MPRLFIYNTEAQQNDNLAIREALTKQFSVMMKRLWYGITFPSAIITLILGPLIWFEKYDFSLPAWLLIKLCFVLLLYVYFFSLQKILKQQLKGIFKYSSMQLRVWNEVATILLIAIVFLAVVKSAISLVYGIVGLILFIVVLMSAIKIYKKIRENKNKP